MVRRQIFRVEWINAGRVDADQSNASVVKMINQCGRQRGEIVVEAFGVGKRARGQEHSFLRDRGSRSSGLITPFSEPRP